jgi:hypothetical protein
MFVIGGEKVGATSVHAVVTSCQEDDVTPICIGHAIENRRENFRLTLRLLPPSRSPCDPIVLQATPAPVRLEEGTMCLEEGPGARARITTATDVYWGKAIQYRRLKPQPPEHFHLDWKPVIPARAKPL